MAPFAISTVGCRAVAAAHRRCRTSGIYSGAASVYLKYLLATTVCQLPTGVPSCLRASASPVSSGSRAFGTDTMMTTVPSEFSTHFRFAEYLLVEPLGMLKITEDKFGHLFADTLMQSPGFKMRTFINASPELRAEEATTTKVMPFAGKDFLNLIMGPNKREFVTQYVYLVNVGARCCGHKGVWHGGVTSAIFDNAFGVLGSTLLKMGATKYLNIQFRAPIMVGDWVAVVVEFDPANIEHGKSDRFVAKGKMYNQHGVVVATGESELVDVSGRWCAKPRTE